MPATVPGAMIAKIAETTMADALFMVPLSLCEIELTLRICGAVQKKSSSQSDQGRRYSIKEGSMPSIAPYYEHIR